jgi:hypothetical protein
MNATMWVLQGLLAFTFLTAGALKVLRPKEEIAAIPHMRWAARLSALQVKLLGVAEIVGSLGLVEPWATGILPVLTPIAAACFALLMVGASILRARREESPMLQAALAVTAAIVAYARFRSLTQGGGA